MKSITVAVCIIVLLGCVTRARADGIWNEVSYGNPDYSNKIVGPDQSYASTKPESGDWTVSYDLRYVFADEIRVYSAHWVKFNDFLVASAKPDVSSHLYFKIVLSTPVTSVTWDLPPTHTDISGGARLAARYSTDATNWSDAHIYPTGGQDPQPVTFSLNQHSDVIYIGWFAEVPTGGRGYWHHNNIGMLTFIPAQKSTNQGQHRKVDAGNVSNTDPKPASADQRDGRFIPNTFFGTTTHVNREGSMQMLKYLNMRTVRLDFAYNLLEPERGKYGFSPGNYIIDSADLGAKLNLDQMALIGKTPPGWAATGSGAFPNDQSVDAFEEFMYAIATKYKGKIRNWEALNEVHMPDWKETYATMLKAFYRGVKRADPENIVVLGTFDTNEAQSLDEAYKYGIKGYFDVMNTHPYTWSKLPEEGGYVGKIEGLRKVMKKYGDDKPIWVSEIGWNGVEPSMLEYLRSKSPLHKARSTTEEDQARALARLYLISASIPYIERVYFFGLGVGINHTQVSEDEIQYMGICSEWEGGTRPKPAFFSLRTVIEMIGESTYKERINMGSRVGALVFHRSSDAIIALWSLDDNVTMILEDASMIESVTSMVGTPMLLSDNKLHLSGSPIYLKVPVKKLEQIKKQIQEAKLLGSRMFQLVLGLDPEKSSADESTVAVTVTNAGNHSREHPEIYLNVHPTSWNLSRPQILDNKPIPAGQGRTYSVAVKGPAVNGGEIAFDVSARLLDGTCESKAERTIRYIVARVKPDNFIADGMLNEWDKMTPIEIGKTTAQREYSGWDGPQDCAVQWYCAYDRQALYFAAEVKDDIHHQPLDSTNADGIWGNDSIQIGLDVAGDAQPISNVLRYDGVNDYEIGFALGTEGPIGYCWENPKSILGVLNFRDYKVVRDESSKVTRYEVAIPWSLLGLDIAPTNRWMGMNVVVNDNDGKGREGWLEWAPGIAGMKDPSHFPKVLISGPKLSG